MSKTSDNGPKVPLREAPPPLPKRFYKTVAVEAVAQAAAPRAGDYRILLDGRPARTPRKKPLVLPARALADAVAEEWSMQSEHIDPARMPLTRLVNTVLDGVAGREAHVAADIIKYAGSDLTCYRADSPRELAERQETHWQPLLHWAQSELGAAFVCAVGVMPVSQPAAALEKFSGAVSGLDAYRLAALHVMTTLTGSAVVALAVLRNKISLEGAWTAAHVDEDWQISQWGEDADAARRRRQRWAEMQAAGRLLQLIGAA